MAPCLCIPDLTGQPRKIMTEAEQKLYSKMEAIEHKLVNLRQGYLIVNKRYNEAIGSLKELTQHTMIAAKKAAEAALISRQAADRAAAAARLAADSHIIAAAEAAADAAQAVKLSHAASASARRARDEASG